MELFKMKKYLIYDDGLTKIKIVDSLDEDIENYIELNDDLQKQLKEEVRNLE